MRTHVEFRSTAFPSEPGEEEQINPGRWGTALARHLRVELSHRGVSTREPGFEDWGCYVPIENADFELWVGCGNYEHIPDGFLCFIEAFRPRVRRIFRKVNVDGRVAEVAAAMDSALKAHPEVRDIRWWTDEEART